MELLAAIPVKELRAKAKALGVNVTSLDHKEDLVRAVAHHPRAREALRAELQDPIKAALWRRDFKELKELAALQGINPAQPRWDLIAALAANHRVGEAERPAPPPSPGEPPEQVPEELPPPEPAPEPEQEPPPSEPFPLDPLAEGLMREAEEEPEEAPEELPPPTRPVAETAPEPVPTVQEPPAEPLPTPDPPPPRAESVLPTRPPEILEVPSVALLSMPRSSARPAPAQPTPPPREREEPRAVQGGDIILMVDPDESPPPTPQPAPPLEAPEPTIYVEVPPGPPTAPKAPPPPTEDEILLRTALPYPGDMMRLHNLLGEADRRWRAGDHTMAMAQARDAIALFEEAGSRYLRSAWAHVITSMETLLKDAHGPAPTVHDARAALRDLQGAFRADDLHGQKQALDHAMGAISSLFLSEAEILRRDITKALERVREVATMGGIVDEAQSLLQGATEALRTGDRAKGVELLKLAAARTDEALAHRMAEMKASLVALEYTLQEAVAMGSPPGEAAKLLDQAKVALGNGEGLLSHELLQRAERAIAEVQRAHVDQATELHKRQMEKVKQVVRRIKPIMAEAQTYGLDIVPIRTNAKEALLRVRQGDYVNALLYAKQAGEAVRALQPQLLMERSRRGIAKPPGGICGRCASRNLEFSDDGWGHCRDCGMDFRWRRTATPQALLHRLRNTVLAGQR